MSRKSLSMFLIFLLVISQLLHAQQVSKSEGEARVKAHIEKYGIGRYQKVELVLHNNKKWKGYISEVHDDRFVFVHKNSDKQSTLAYAQVKEIKSAKPSNRKKIAIWSAVAGAAAVLGWFAYISAHE